MKKTHILLGSLLLLIMTSCNVGVNKDLLSGLKVTNNGLSYEEAYLSVAGQKTTNTEFPLQTEVNLIASGIKGYVIKDSLVYIGASLSVFDKDNKEVLNYPDLFAAYDSTGVSPVDAEVITLTLTTGNPMLAGESYIWKTRIWDKNGKGEINTEVKISVKKTN